MAWKHRALYVEDFIVIFACTQDRTDRFRFMAYVNQKGSNTTTDASTRLACSKEWDEPWLTVMQTVETLGTHSYEQYLLPPQLEQLLEDFILEKFDTQEFAQRMTNLEV